MTPADLAAKLAAGTLRPRDVTPTEVIALAEHVAALTAERDELRRELWAERVRSEDPAQRDGSTLATLEYRVERIERDGCVQCRRERP